MNQQARKTGLMKLCDDTLNDLPDGVSRPGYNRSALRPGIVHIGLGNFHRAHQAWYLHRLMQAGEALDWAIIGAGVRRHDEAQRQKLAAQDYLTTLIELDPSSRSAEVIGSMIGYVPVVPDNSHLIEQIAQPCIRIVSLTVTEGGYYVDPATKKFNAAHPDIVYDAANPKQPKTAFGAMVAALDLRRERGIGPLTGLSCDNLQGNGAVLRQSVVSLAQLSDPSLAAWIDRNCSFPNSMVDCIVPATGSNELDLVRAIGIDDAVPVTHEPFRQWVIEDDFCAGKPAWDKVGATFSEDVRDYETMKIRLLNAGHQVIANAAELLGIETIAKCMADARLSALFDRVTRSEIAPHVKSVPGTSALAYVDLITRRFANPQIVDTTRRVAFDGSSRHPGFVVPSIRDAITAGTSVEGLALVEATWARMCVGTREDGSVIEPNDPNWDELRAVAVIALYDPAAWLAQSQYYGDLATAPAFAHAFGKWLGIISAEGTAAAIDRYLAS